MERWFCLSYCHSHSGDTPGELLANPELGWRAGDTPSPSPNVLIVTQAAGWVF